MPKIFEWSGYKFFFFSNEGTPRERCHVHVRKGEKTAKFWIEPSVTLESAYEMSSQELNKIEKVILEKSDLIRSKWNEFFRA
ncbi:MAG: hypothetical protein A2992_03870 [Elusimicrobia bacterium RIFCSPLOWO2_01_FULL_59_12]|nr:MAG: hypothetical protein A2992_03870 [Elusimicrobia bacterium RIFCSPLOWO2_01_FULL_59_12]